MAAGGRAYPIRAPAAAHRGDHQPHQSSCIFLAQRNGKKKPGPTCESCRVVARAESPLGDQTTVEKSRPAQANTNLISMAEKRFAGFALSADDDDEGTKHLGTKQRPRMNRMPARTDRDERRGFCGTSQKRRPRIACSSLLQSISPEFGKEGPPGVSNAAGFRRGKGRKIDRRGWRVAGRCSAAAAAS